MSKAIKFFISFKLLTLMTSTVLLGQEFGYSDDSPTIQQANNGVVTGEDFVLAYQVDPILGVLSLSLKDGNFDHQLFEEYRVGRDFLAINHEVVAQMVYLLLSNQNSFKMICVIDTKARDIKFYPISVNLGRIDQFRIIGNTLLVVESLEKGDFVQLYDYRSGVLISLSELFYPKTRVWDVQVKGDVFDILIHKKGDYTNQSLRMIGFATSGTKVYEKEILPLGPKKLIFKSAKLISSPESGYSIVGTYAKKQGEQFSGYYHVSVNDFLEQEAKIHPMRSLEGFFDYKKNPGWRRNAKNLRREMVVYHSKTDGKYIAMASSSDKVVRKFVHFVLLDHSGARIYDTSVKVFYGLGNALSDYSTLGLIDKDLYFIFEGNSKYNVLPGYKLYQIKEGNLAGLLRIEDFMQMKRNFEQWEEVKFYHWKENKFIVSGIETVNGTSRHVVQKIEV
jgi:hypothetical protein